MEAVAVEAVGAEPREEHNTEMEMQPQGSPERVPAAVPHFRRSLRTGVGEVFRQIGFPGRVGVSIVVLARTGRRMTAVHVESDEGESHDVEALRLINRGHLARDADADDDREAAGRARGAALVKVLRRTSGGAERFFFCGMPVVSGDGEMHLVLSVDAQARSATPRLRTTRRSPLPMTPSMVDAVAEEALFRACAELQRARHGLSAHPLGVATPEIVRGATERFVRSVVICTDHWFGSDTNALLSAISALPYEGRASKGSLILAKRDDPGVDVLLRIREQVGLDNIRAVRKLIEASDSEIGLLVGKGAVYGLGRISDRYDPATETVFRVLVSGRGAWDLCHGGSALLSVRDGAAALPAPTVDAVLFKETIERQLPGADVAVLTDLARTASTHEHGAMLVVSAKAAAEARRLAPQTWEVDPAQLSPELLRRLTHMDGAVLLDRYGQCHAVGVILDGLADGGGDPARGSRYNNAVRYLSSDPPAAVIVVYSTDGSVDILPAMHRRVERETVDAAVRAFLALVETGRPQPEDVSLAWAAVKSFAFYLSPEQCRELNDSRARLGSQFVGFVPDPRMNESYWLDT